MEMFPTSLFSTKDLTDSQIEHAFQLTYQFKCHFLETKKNQHSKPFLETLEKGEASFSKKLLKLKQNSFLVLQAFFEPSTRTKVSFEMAARRLGLSVFTQDFILSSSSQKKGESLLDSLEVLEAMKPDLFIVRYDGSKEIKKKLQTLSCPFINAGAGNEAHPTQALLDAFTVQELRTKKGEGKVLKKDLKGEKVLLVGDVFHSRVAASQKLLFERLGAQVALSIPERLREEFSSVLPFKGLRFFSKLSEGLRWCSFCVALRWQEERHSDSFKKLLQKEENNLLSFQLNQTSIKDLSSNALILHPGPVNWGKEMDISLKLHPRFQALRQITNGVFLRMSLLFLMLQKNLKEI